MNDYKKFLADILIKVFQIVFAMLVVGMFIQDRFDSIVFLVGVIVSIFCLTVAIALYYNSVEESD